MARRPFGGAGNGCAHSENLFADASSRSRGRMETLDFFVAHVDVIVVDDRWPEIDLARSVRASALAGGGDRRGDAGQRELGRYETARSELADFQGPIDDSLDEIG